MLNYFFLRCVVVFSFHWSAYSSCLHLFWIEVSKLLWRALSLEWTELARKELNSDRIYTVHLYRPFFSSGVFVFRFLIGPWRGATTKKGDEGETGSDHSMVFWKFKVTNFSVYLSTIVKARPWKRFTFFQSVTCIMLQWTQIWSQLNTFL